MRALTLIVLTMGLALVSCSGNAPTGQLGLPTERGTAAPTAAPRTSAPRSSAAPTPSRSPGSSSSPAASPTASASASPAPPTIVSASATQVSLTVAYSAPMRTSIACATSGEPAAITGTIDDPTTLHYRSSDGAFDEAMKSASHAMISADCTTVTFLFDLVAPAGAFTINVTDVVDRSGTPIDTTRASVRVNVADQGRPQAVSVTSSGDRIMITYSEPMTEIGEGGGVTLAGNYRLDGAQPLGARLSCVDAGCRRVWLTLPGDTLVPGRSYQLRIANTVDRAGKNITPDPTTITFKAG